MTLKTDQNLNGPLENLLSPINTPMNDLKLKISQQKGYIMIGKTLLLSMCIASTSLAFAGQKQGAGSGGGGDATEERVNEIRSDILKWIKNGGAKELVLSPALTYNDYVASMSDILQPKKVVIGFVVQDDKKNDELKVSVNGMPKTCRGFNSKIDSKPHIICNISRFKATSDAEQYKLIHHEYAGLANIEQNDKAASDYTISSQITDYLSQVTVTKLAIKKAYDVNGVALSASASIRQKLSSCIAKDESATNPTVIECNKIAITQADKEIKKVAALILTNLSGIDAHGRDLSLAKPMFEKEIKSFYDYRDNASSIAGVVDGGTGSDILVANTSLKIDLTLNQLKSLEARSNF